MIAAIVNHLSLAFWYRRKGNEIQVKQAAIPGRRWKNARAILVFFLLGTLAIQLAALAVLDGIRPGVRDLEYGRRITALRARIDENPSRQAVLVIGSSRTAMGVRPGEWEQVRPAKPGHPDPLLLNMSLIGSGPLMELLIVRRAFADGLQPSLVLLEYWPPFLRAGEGYDELKRISIDRLYPDDRAIVRDYFPEHEQAEREMKQNRLNPIWGARNRILLHSFPRLLPTEMRIEWTWNGVDGWGWRAGSDLETGSISERAAFLKRSQAYYEQLLADYRVSSAMDRAFREAVSVVRSHGSRVGFLYLPESSEFRGWHLANLSDNLGVPVIEARTWMDDGLIADGFHLSQLGAAEFTRKLGLAIAAAFPGLGDSP